ncbi:hypothetical protein HO173_007209 [Letharia columbiana]|uniref:Uncharacterized protein n=1 Tax=Letharia columbiana TaxID=112416 RepID=A0A8H6L3V5_9LECA|nr:uncharacterized protein HO173_007209 [Letharia columbiana]KAF6234583.1 hypothetical protein HO173_007209 [Letharia columbiana]
MFTKVVVCNVLFIVITDRGRVKTEKDEEDEGFYSGEEEYELDDSFESDEEVQDSFPAGDKTRAVSQSTQLGALWPKIGCVSAASNEGTGTGDDLDWALIEFDKPADYRPNLLLLFDREEEAAENRPLKENGKFTEDGSSRSVILLSGMGGVKNGTLSTSLSFLMMGPAKAFTKTYTLVLPHGSVLNAGDCGSWVVDPSTCEVYGHVVASDAMGDIYVVPLNATLRDMEKKLGADPVSLPTKADILTWLAQHAEAAAEQVTITARSNKKKVAFNDSKMDKVELPRDLQKLAGHSSSQASTSPAPSAIKTSTPIVDYCNSCNARFEGTSRDVRSNLLCHLRTTCSRQNEDVAPGIEGSISQGAKDILDERSERSSVENSKDVRQRTIANTSTQQTSPVPWSIRSMYPNFKKKSDSDSQQKDGDNGKSISNSKDNKPARFASSKKPAATASPTSISRDLKDDTKKSNSKKHLHSSPISKRLHDPSSALAGRISRDLPPAPPTPPVLPDQILSPPLATPLSPRLRQGGRLLAPFPPRLAPRLVHGHESFHESSSDGRHLSHNSKSRQVSYEGYNFTKCDSKQTGQKETWAVAKLAPMPVSQEDLKDQIKRNRRKHTSALDEYNDERMKGSKRKQVDNLIHERTKVDGDYGFEYVLASIKLDSRKTKSKSTETVSMQVILKRQLIAHFPHDSSTDLSMDFPTKLPSQVMDVTSGDEPGRVRNFGSGSQDVGHGGAAVSFAGHPEHGAFPESPAHGQSFGHGVQHVGDKLPPFHTAPHPLNSLDSPAQGVRQPPQPHSVPLIHQEMHSTQGHLEKVNNSKPKKKKVPKVVHITPETRKKRDNLSSSPSLSSLSSELDSDNSWTKTDATPDTVASGESREYRKEKESDKERNERSYDKDNIEWTPYTQERERPVYLNHGEEEHRRPYLAPAQRFRDVSSDWIHPRQDLDLDLDRHGRRLTSLRYSYGPRYRDDGHYEVEPAISVAARHRRSSVSPERPSQFRAPSYDLDRPPAHPSRALVPIHHRPAVYRDTTGDFSRAVDVYDHGAELPREQERLRLRREEDEAWARRMRELERHDREERDAQSDARIERMREMERSGRVTIDREGSRRGTAYDDYHYTCGLIATEDVSAWGIQPREIAEPPTQYMAPLSAPFAALALIDST